MARPKKAWSTRVGERGASVLLYERERDGPLWLRWWVRPTGNAPGRDEYRPLGHSDRTIATQTAREVAGALLASTLAAAQGKATVADVLSVYFADVATHWKGQGPTEAKRRVLIWSSFLGANRDVATLDFPTMDRFTRERRAGRIKIEREPGKPVKLKANPSDRAIGADIDFLLSALNHATRVVRDDGKRLLEVSPLRGYRAPRNKNVRRPVATYDRFLKLIEKADEADPQRLFGGLMMLVESLGWRITAIVSLRARDFDLKATATNPHGRVFKNPDMDKEGVGGWLPMSKAARDAVDRIRAVNPCIGDWPMFPAPKAREKGSAQPAAPVMVAAPMIQPAEPVSESATKAADEIPKHWSRYHARALLGRAEALANLEPLDGSDFHAYRRAWASSRKHLPAQDVANVGGWRDLRTLQNAYQQTDDETILAVVNEPRKVRELKAVEGKVG